MQILPHDENARNIEEMETPVQEKTLSEWLGEAPEFSEEEKPQTFPAST